MPWIVADFIRQLLILTSFIGLVSWLSIAVVWDWTATLLINNILLLLMVIGGIS